MEIWFFFALMTGAAVLAVLWPLSRRPEPAVAPADGDAAFFRQQIAEIERDCARGLMSAAEAEAAKAEAGRRLLRAAQASGGAEATEGEPALRRRRAASAIALSTIPLVALALYGAVGSPHLPGQPLAARLQQDPRSMDVGSAVARIEAHLAKAPDDGRGWEVLAPVYLRSGRAADAVKAYESALRLLGETPQRLADYAEAIVASTGGVVSAEARAAFDKALARDATLPKARFYLAVAAEQDGDKAGAVARLKDLRASATEDSPWLAVVSERIARLEGTDAAAAIAALPERDRLAAIRGMVSGLAARLESDGSDAEGWLRLVRAHVVLGDIDKAQAALAKAAEKVGGDADTRARLTELARELKLDMPETTPEAAPRTTQKGDTP